MTSTNSNDATPSLNGLVSSLRLTPSLSGLVSSLRLTSVSDRRRWPALVKEEALGDRKPSEILRRMRSLVGNMTIDDKFLKEIFLERLSTSVQTISASGSNDLDISKLAEMADRMMEVERLSSPTIAQVSQPLTVSTSDLAELKTQIAQLSATVAALQLRRSPVPLEVPSAVTVVVPAPAPGPPTYVRIMSTMAIRHGAVSHPAPSSPRRKLLGRRVNAAELSGNSTGRIFYVRDNTSGRQFLVDTGAQISVIPPTPADRRCPNYGLQLQAANCSPIPTFGSLFITLNIALRRSFTRIFVIVDVPHGILGSDFLAEFDLIVDIRGARLFDRTTGLFVRALTPFTTPTNLSVLDTDIASPFRQLLLSQSNIINPQFRSGELQHDVVHHIRTSDPPVFARPRRLALERFHAAKAEFEHML
ncbi:hypothetical protein SprV_0501918200 [Sparganum proliferum]